MPTIVRENHDSQNATLTLTIPVADYQPKFKAQLTKFKNQAHMKGFRKGKTPMSVIRKMYGKGTLVDLINKMVGEELDKYIKEENLDLLGHPLPSEDQVNYEFETKDLEDFEFKFDVGLAPEFEVQGLDDTEFKYYDAEIPDSMVEGDLENARKQLSSQDSVDDEIQEEDVIKLQADELDGDNIKDRGFANEFSVAYNLLTDEAKALFKGKKKGDLVEFDIFNLEKERDESFVRRYFIGINEDADDQPEVGKMFRAVISDVTRATPAELNQAFFDKYVGEGKVSSEEELMDVLKERTKMYYDRRADAFLFRDIKEHLEKENPLTFPEEFLKRWMKASGNIPEGKTADEEIGNLTEGLVWSLIRGKLAKRFEITVSEVEIKQRLRMQLVQMFGGQDFGSMLDDYVDKMYGEEQQYHNAYTQVLSDKLFNAMKEVVTLNKESITTDELEKLIEEENAKNQPPAPEPLVEEALKEADEAEEGIEEAEIVEE
ncbi:MAG: trigger factor [Bacteroidota bacterium]